MNVNDFLHAAKIFAAHLHSASERPACVRIAGCRGRALSPRALRAFSAGRYNALS
jgi:hypothetical protein